MYTVYLLTIGSIGKVNRLIVRREMSCRLKRRALAIRDDIVSPDRNAGNSDYLWKVHCDHW